MRNYRQTPLHSMLTALKQRPRQSMPPFSNRTKGRRMYTQGSTAAATTGILRPVLSVLSADKFPAPRFSANAAEHMGTQLLIARSAAGMLPGTSLATTLSRDLAKRLSVTMAVVPQPINFRNHLSTNSHHHQQCLSNPAISIHRQLRSNQPVQMRPLSFSKTSSPIAATRQSPTLLEQLQNNDSLDWRHQTSKAAQLQAYAKR